MAKKTLFWISGLFLIVLLTISSCSGRIGNFEWGTASKSETEVKININVPDVQTPVTTEQNKQGTTTSNPEVKYPTKTTKPAGSSVQTCSAPNGFFSIVYLRQKNYVNIPSIFGTPNDNKAHIAGIWKYTGNCIADKIYIETGVRNEPSNTLFAILPSELRGGVTGEPSACDGSKNYQGVVFKNVQPNADLKFDIYVENYGVESSYPVNIGSYTGCLKSGGYTIQEIYGKTSFSDKYTPFDLIYSYVQVK